jgi:putative transposase
MTRVQAYKFKIEPNGTQLRALRQFAGNARKVWNLALARQQTQYAAGESFTNAFGMNYWLPAWKKELSYLKASPSQTLQQVMADLNQGYQNFFAKRAAHPVFKKKGHYDSFRYPQGYELDQKNSRIFLPKLGWLRYRNSRDVLGTIKNVTVSCSSNTWHVSIQTEREVAQPIMKATSLVGIDLGITRFATLSDGTVVEPRNSFKRHQRALAKAQRVMSRKEKFSRNWKKARARVQRIHTRIAHVRQDFLHKTSTTISNNHAMVIVEDLKVGNMSRSAAGTVKEPGKNVRAKSGLNRAVLDQGWGEFRRQLDYKLSWNGGMLLAVPAHHTSQTCPTCGHVSKDNRRTQARFACVECHYENNADLVGAVNILARGIAHLQGEGQDTTAAAVGQATAAQIACEVNGARARQQQEPTEVSQLAFG